MRRGQISKDFKGSSESSLEREQNAAIRSSSMTTTDQTIASDVREQFKDEP